MLAIYKRELRAYFTSAIGYIFVAVFLILSGLSFAFTTLLSNTTDVSFYYTIMMFLFIILIPILTMRLLSEEKKLKTEQILLTAPVSLTKIVLAKYLAAFTLFTLTFAISNLNFIALYIYGTPNTPILISTSLGILIIGAAFIAIGLFVSSLTENQLVSAIFTIAIIGIMMFIGLITSTISNDFVRVILKWFSFLDRYTVFTFGIFDFNALVYFLSFVVVFLFLTVRIYEKRRWD